MMYDIRYYGDPVLRKKAAHIPAVTDDIRQLAVDMIETMDDGNGIGLAAPQIGVSKRIFVIRLYDDTEDGEHIPHDAEIFINPILSDPSSDIVSFAEGCLSIPGIYEDILRPEAITVHYQNLNGDTLTQRLSGLKARVVMHENDHLNGTFFVDRIAESSIKSEIAPYLKKLREQYDKRTL